MDDFAGNVPLINNKVTKTLGVIIKINMTQNLYYSTIEKTIWVLIKPWLLNSRLTKMLIWKRDKYF